MANLSIKLFKLRCKHCGQYFVRKAIRGLEFTFICDKCGQRADYKIPLRDEKQNKTMYSVDEQFALFPEIMKGANFEKRK